MFGIIYLDVFYFFIIKENRACFTLNVWMIIQQRPVPADNPEPTWSENSPALLQAVTWLKYLLSA